jgi:D-alanyl-D-alanine carboxypeptidase
MSQLKTRFSKLLVLLAIAALTLRGLTHHVAEAATESSTLDTHAQPQSETSTSTDAIPSTTIGSPDTPANVVTLEVPTFLSINQTRGMDQLAINAIGQFVANSPIKGLATTIVHQGTLEMSDLVRNNVHLLSLPADSGIPMSTLSVDPNLIAATMGQDVATTLANGKIVLGRTAASIARIEVGDSLTLIGWNGARVTFDVGFVAEDASVSGVEVVLSLAQANSLAFNRPFSMRVWNFPDRASAEAIAQSLRSSWSLRAIRIRESWQTPLLDDTIPQAKIKELLGSFWVARSASTEAIQIDPAWKRAHIAPVTLPLIGTIRCNTVVAAAARDAINDLVTAGLSALINAKDTRTKGGCFSARVTRTTTGTSGHNLSRHTWGAALDINPSNNKFGGVSHMDPRVIEAFRRHGFAWGGTFLYPDPMHFEYIGAPRT